MSLKTKKRSDEFILREPSVIESSNWGTTWSEQDAPLPVLRDDQITDSEGHRVNANTGYRNAGGPFHTCRYTLDFPTIPFEFKSEYQEGRFRRRGSVGTPILNSFLPEEIRSICLNAQTMKDACKGIDLDADGATAIAQVAPLNPNANLATSLGEIVNEGKISLPGIATWKNRAAILKSAADEFLSYEFGWKPLTEEIDNTVNSVRKGREMLEQYRRDSGKTVRREFAFPIDKQTKTRLIGSFRPSPVPYGGDAQSYFNEGKDENGFMDLWQTYTIKSRKWFSGAFVYVLPDQTDSWKSFMRHAQEADKLFGTITNPETLWELAPWSWAIDWFTNTGDVIHNIQQLVGQGLVMRYGYMMHEKRIEVSNQFVPSSQKQSYYGLTHIPGSHLVVTSKRRVEANPFGFGIGWEDLSPTQLAITAALGISRWLR